MADTATIKQTNYATVMEENQKEVRKMVMNSYHDMEQGKGRDYKELILPLAEEDIINNTDYIAFEKKAPETALELAMGFRNSIAKLEFMPRQHELDEDEDEELALRGIRKCYYKNYKIYFFIDEKNGIVYVLRVLHMLVNAKPLLLNIGF